MTSTQKRLRFGTPIVSTIWVVLAVVWAAALPAP